ncbi:MAG: dephospho-CoA kinase [Deltaproteobacteria bacterium]|nr:dephospho-CoA kinase [Deltaproteobacteria bacterium]
MRIIGLTGGICSGKSTVSRMFRKRGARIVDADEIARRVVEPGRPALAEIARAFGDEMIRPDGSLDRQRLAALIFSNAEQRSRLNSIVHPRVAEEQARIIARIAREDPDALVVIDAALLIEVGGHKDVEKLIVAYVPLEIQAERLMRRDRLSREEALLRIRSQMPLEEKAEMADFVVDNSGSLDETERQVKAVYRVLERSG